MADDKKKKAASKHDIEAATKRALGESKGEHKAKQPSGTGKGDKAPSAVPAAARAEADAAALHARTRNCPRCDLELIPESYEGRKVERCDVCWGYWVTRAEFEKILTSKDEVFSREERRGASGAQAHNQDRKVLQCVKCRKNMQKLAVEDSGNVAFLVDYCRDHGLWLDTGEIKRAQILDEKAGAVRAALRESFDRAAVESDED